MIRRALAVLTLAVSMAGWSAQVVQPLNDDRPPYVGTHRAHVVTPAFAAPIEVGAWRMTIRSTP